MCIRDRSTGVIAGLPSTQEGRTTTRAPVGFSASTTMARRGPNQASQECGVCKLLMIGDSGVGKSSILLRFVDDQFNDSGMDPTIGVDFKVKMVKAPAQELTLKLTIWDTAGQERFRTLTSAYYRGAHGIVLVYDVGRKDSFEALKSVWLKEVDLYSTYGNAVKLLIGNKIDTDVRQVSREEGLEFAREYNTLFIECSAKTKVGVVQAFDEVVSKILETPSLSDVVIKQPTRPAVTLTGGNSHAHNNAGGCGC
eukprot:TRINITY_DN1038_c0_g1_i1.p1 TRINITY_DN1038_c0_g1~~TRINITY_DN1038_c0_g1_i1.p1  ORF type:complete len:253 (-),score=50.93 TRINITY_DN1038_c0_g1_i1:365-1123(-)